MLGQLQLVQPTTLQEASEALTEFGDKAKIYAGGAELLLLLRNGLLATEILVDVKKIERLHCLSSNDGTLRIGACVTHRELESSSLVRAHAPAFCYAESQVANIRVRGQGTLGGNLAFNDPHSDPGTALLIHDASVIIGSRAGERRISLDEFLLDMYATPLEPAELLLEIHVPGLPEGMRSAYQRLHRYQRPTVGVAAGVRMNGERIADIRLAVGCIGPRARRLTDLEVKMRGSSLADARGILAGQRNYLRELFRPVDDLLGSAEYKLYMTAILLGDALEQAARGNGAQ